MMKFLVFLFIFAAVFGSSFQSNDISGSYNKFALRLYEKLAKGKDENVFYSPYSIASALSMCLLGARNETQAQLSDLLGFNSLENVNTGNAQLFNYLNQFKGDNLTLNIANKMYPKQGFPIRREFTRQLQDIFQSYVHLIDFSSPSFSANIINSWISNQTNNKINDLLKAEHIDEFTVLVLINAIYFQGNWFYSFDKDDTKTEKFRLDDDTTKDVEMMHLTNGYFKLRRNPASLNALVCEFPYVGRSLSMTVILPNEGVKLSEIESVLDYEKIKSMFEVQAYRTRVEVSMPKFKFEQSFELSDLLSKMGAPDAFDSRKANFSGISPLSGLYITKVLHKSVIEIGEEGTEAASATAILSSNRNSVIDFAIDTPPVFKCDKPFIFIIHENLNNTILFIGKYVK